MTYLARCMTDAVSPYDCPRLAGVRRQAKMAVGAASFDRRHECDRYSYPWLVAYFLPDSLRINGQQRNTTHLKPVSETAGADFSSGARLNRFAASCVAHTRSPAGLRPSSRHLCPPHPSPPLLRYRRNPSGHVFGPHDRSRTLRHPLGASRRRLSTAHRRCTRRKPGAPSPWCTL